MLLGREKEVGEEEVMSLLDDLDHHSSTDCFATFSEGEAESISHGHGVYEIDG
jgi:hypothetical protein